MNQRNRARNFIDMMLSVPMDLLIWTYTIVLGTLSLVSSLFDRSGSVQHWFARAWSWLILRTALSRVTVAGLENIPNGPAVYAANHQSAFDIPLLYVYLPFQFRIMAKVELFKYPFMGWHLSRSGQIPIDEKDLNLAGLKKGVKTLKANMPLVVFPEGGRTPDGEIKRFMSGAFYLAIKARVPVVPVAIIGTYEVLPMNTFVIHPGKMQLVIGRPIPTEGYTTRDTEAVSEKVKSAIEEMYYERALTPRPVVQREGVAPHTAR